MVHHRALEYEVTEDQLALAAMHYLRAHYQEAADIYKNIFKNNRKYVALNVYIARVPIIMVFASKLGSYFGSSFQFRCFDTELETIFGIRRKSYIRLVLFRGSL